MGGIRFKILVSAGDVGAAFHLCEVIKCAQDIYNTEIFLVASKEALLVFKSAGIEVNKMCVTRSCGDVSRNDQKLLDEAVRLIESFVPDAILVGLSGSGRGIDEALIASARGIRTYALQDYWGDVQEGFGRFPHTYFVLDFFAERATKIRVPSANVVVSGSARHSAILDLNANQLRKDARAKFAVADDQWLVSFYGQPLWHIPGYKNILTDVGNSMKIINPNSLLVYRAHPREGSSDKGRAIECLSSAGANVILDKNQMVEETLCASDLRMSCYSTCVLDYAYVTKKTSMNFGLSLNLIYEEDILSYYYSTSGLSDLPYEKLGIALAIRDRNDLKHGIVGAMTNIELKKNYEKALELLPNQSGAADFIIQYILKEGACQKSNGALQKFRRPTELWQK